MKNVGIVCLYITLSRRNAKKIIWRELLAIFRKYEIEGKLTGQYEVDKQELSITVHHADGDSVIYVSGAKDEQEIEKFRGLPLFKVYIDECQSFREYLRDLIDEVIEPALFDYDGSLALIGTPGPLCSGFFYESTHPKEPGTWSNHHWTLHDNPHIQKKSGKTVEQLLEAQRKRRGITEDDPTYQRESLGKWVSDKNALVYKYNASKNDYATLPELPPGHKYTYILGVDIGWEDSDALAVLAYSEHGREVYLVEEIVQNKQTITDLANLIHSLSSKYEFTKIVMDSGALGKKIQEEIKQRHGLHIEAAQKTRKLEFIELLNDDLRTGLLKIKENSVTAHDYNKIQWDYIRSVNGKRVISDTFHSDISDAVLYAWREAKHFTYEKPIEQPLKGTDAFMDAMEKEEADKFKQSQNPLHIEPLYDANETPWWAKE